MGGRAGGKAGKLVIWGDMATVRRRISLVIVSWLLCHASVLAVTPLAMCQRLETALAEACTCDHGPGQICPMHHREGSPAKSKCSCRDTANQESAALASLI